VHVIIATDGSQQSLEAAAYLQSFADPATIEEIAVLAVVSPLAAVPFAAERATGPESIEDMSFRKAAEQATRDVAARLEGWGPAVTTHVWSGSPSGEIVRAAREMNTGLIVLASRSTRTEAVLMGSVAHRVMNHAPCPVLVVRPGDKPRRGRKA
jgi:nucleotide-binding universal stress UspA family protein